MDDELHRMTFGPAYSNGESISERVSDLKRAAGEWSAKANVARRGLGASRVEEYAGMADDCLRRAANLEHNF